MFEGWGAAGWETEVVAPERRVSPISELVRLVDFELVRVDRRC